MIKNGQVVLAFLVLAGGRVAAGGTVVGTHYSHGVRDSASYALVCRQAATQAT